MAKILDVKTLSQRDNRWKAQKLGNSNSSIGDYGCVLTSVAMFIQYVLKNDILPPDLNRMMTDNGGYDKDIWQWTALTKIYPEVRFDGRKDYYNVSADIPLIKSYIDKNLPVVVLLDFDRGKAGVQDHFVLVVGYTDNDLIINDPWYGDRIELRKRYGNQDPKVTLLGARLYSATSVSSPDWANGVKEVFVAEGYTYPETYPDVVKVLLNDHKALLETEGKFNELRHQIEELNNKITKLESEKQKLEKIMQPSREIAENFKKLLEQVNNYKE